MPAFWRLSTFPKCLFHVFLSHCAEDRSWLVWPLYEILKAERIIPWVDRHHYPAGRDPFEVLREEILRSRHTVYLVTLATLHTGRGWPTLEKAYGGLLQENLREPTLELCHIELPLFFLPPDHEMLLRSVYGLIRAKGKFAPATSDPAILVAWAAHEIERFVVQEQRYALDISDGVQTDPGFRQRVEDRNKEQPGLKERISGTYPNLDPQRLDFSDPDNSQYLPLIL